MNKTELISILSELEYSRDAYLVGGTVRDMVLGKDPVDIDIVVRRDAERFARNLSAKMEGTLFLLDKKRGVFRIVTKGKFQAFYCDISSMRGEDIFTDLSFRDFTVDALAIPLADIRTIIDPYRGKDDITGKCIRAISRKSFEEDPLRLLRAFRLATTLKFKIDTETFDTIREMSSYLRLAARERIRNEFFRLLSSPKSIQYLKQMYDTGLLKEILAGLENSDIKQGLQVVERLEGLYNTLHTLFSPHDANIESYLFSKIEEGITNTTLWKWISFYRSNGVTEDLIRKASEGLRLGKKAHRIALLGIKYVHPSFLDKDIGDKKSVYRFFKATGDDGIGLILCQMASVATATEGYVTVLRNGREAISWYLDEYKRMKDSPLITGNDLIELLNITPGPAFSHLIDMVEENRAIGKLFTKNDAISLLRKFVTKI